MALSTSAFVISGVCVRTPPSVGSSLLTFRKSGSSPWGTTRIALAGTLPSGPGLTAWTATRRLEGTTFGSTNVPAGMVTLASVLKRTPPSVDTTLPAAMVFEETGL